MKGISQFTAILAGLLFLQPVQGYARIVHPHHGSRSLPDNSEVMDSLAAVVNNEAVTCYQIRQGAEELKQQLKQAGMKRLPDTQTLWERALDSRIVKTLQLQEAKRLGIKVTDEEVSKAIANVEEKNNLPAGQLLDILKARGMDVNRYKQALKDRLLTSKLGNIAVRSRLQIGEESMHEYYRKYLAHPKPVREIQLADIFVALPLNPSPGQVEKSRARIEKLRARIQAGENFGRIATMHSDALDAGQGGRMGWFLPGSLPPRFALVFSLVKGEVSQPIRSSTGFQIFTVTGERWHKPKQHAKAYDEVHVRHILLKLSDAMADKEKGRIKTEAEQIAEEMKGNSDEEFAARAREISQGPSASKGGDLGWFRRGAMVPAFDEAAFALKAGETSGVVKSPFGLHIIRMIERRHVDPDSFEAHRSEIRNILLGIEMQDQLPRWLAGLRARAIIERRGCR